MLEIERLETHRSVPLYVIREALQIGLNGPARVRGPSEFEIERSRVVPDRLPEFARSRHAPNSKEPCPS